MTWFDMAANATTGTASTNLILQDIPFPTTNTITVNGTQFFDQPIHMRRDYEFTMTTMDETLVEETELQRLIRTDPEYGKHRKVPKEWGDLNRRRRKGEKSLLLLLDVCDRLQWYDSKSICLQYPDGGDYKGRILFIHPEGKFEFNSNGGLLNKRNIWIDRHEDRWSYEDMCLTMIIQFQIDPRRFVYEVGCRDSVYPDEYKKLRKDFHYGFHLRIRTKEREKFQNLCNPFMTNRRLPN